jgi:hypothetical protein
MTNSPVASPVPGAPEPPFAVNAALSSLTTRLAAVEREREEIRQAAEIVVAYWPIFREDVDNDAAEFHLSAGVARLRAALATSPTTGPETPNG